jgi:hypothetical protein
MDKKMKSWILCILCLLLTSNIFAQGQERENIIGFGAGISPEYKSSIWIGDPANVWATKKSSPVFQFFYARQVREDVRLGVYFEYESATFEVYNSDDSKASRYNFGVNWIALYPNNALHMQLGGYIGYGSIKSDNWDQSVSGTDIGIMVGPAYEKDNLGIALHVQYGKGYYTSSGIPDEVGLSLPRILLKIYYKL